MRLRQRLLHSADARLRLSPEAVEVNCLEIFCGETRSTASVALSKTSSCMLGGSSGTKIPSPIRQIQRVWFRDMAAGAVNKIASVLLDSNRAASIAAIEFDQMRQKLGMLLYMEDESWSLTLGYFGHERLSPET